MSINSFEIICYKMQIFNNFIKINIYYFMKYRVSDQIIYEFYKSFNSSNIFLYFIKKTFVSCMFTAFFNSFNIT